MKRILLVDDNAAIVDEIKAILEEYFQNDFLIEKAYDGRQALELLSKGYYHVIISDIKMPKLDGIQLLELIHNENIPSTVIMLSGYDDYSYIRKALRLGAYDYLLKPVNIQSFIDMLNGLKKNLCDSQATLKETDITALEMNVEKNDYFDLECSRENCLTMEKLENSLTLLQTAVLELDCDSVRTQSTYIFHHLSETQISKEQLKKLLSNFIYSLMQKNSGLIKIIAQYKLSDNDLSAQIKNQPHLSQLKEKFIQILLIYISRLSEIRKNNEEYVVKKAQSYIAEHYSENLLLADIAAQFKIHPNYFSSLFKKQTGVTVRDYILNLRIGRAKEMMQDSSLKLLDIALAVGYQDAAHFNRAFKNVTGLAPSQYRTGVER